MSSMPVMPGMAMSLRIVSKARLLATSAASLPSWANVTENPALVRMRPNPRAVGTSSSTTRT
jgi:hypothetical protein